MVENKEMQHHPKHFTFPAKNHRHFLKNGNGTYIQPKDFLDEFHIHMHKNRQQALQGMTKQEIQEAEQCVQHMQQETSRPHHI